MITSHVGEFFSRLSLTFLPPVDTHQQFIRSLDGERETVLQSRLLEWSDVRRRCRPSVQLPALHHLSSIALVPLGKGDS